MEQFKPDNKNVFEGEIVSVKEGGMEGAQEIEINSPDKALANIQQQNRDAQEKQTQNNILKQALIAQVREQLYRETDKPTVEKPVPKDIETKSLSEKGDEAIQAEIAVENNVESALFNAKLGLDELMLHYSKENPESTVITKRERISNGETYTIKTFLERIKFLREKLDEPNITIDNINKTLDMVPYSVNLDKKKMGWWEWYWTADGEGYTQ
jgi:hypothetical protein